MNTWADRYAGVFDDGWDWIAVAGLLAAAVVGLGSGTSAG
jgi:hypothetical protein